jgi:modulator of FtsH protease HflK
VSGFDSNTPITPGGQPPAGDPSRRALSVQLRGGRVADDTGFDSSESMDPANQSLADAIQITYRIVQLAMVVLAVLFVFSGMQSVREGERGIRLLFGQREPTLLDPGLRLSAPYPVGEMIKVSTGVINIDLAEEFWPFVSRDDRTKPIEQLVGRNSLKPENDGSLITSDGALAHSKWSIRYRRTDPGLFAENLLPEVEERLVRAAVQRGVVQAAAATRVDDLLKQSNDNEGSLAARAREIAQRTLDGARSGITIEQLSLTEKMPPLHLREKFAAVQTAAQNGEKASADAKRILSEAAGGAAQSLINLIDEYETSIETKNADAQRTILAKIDEVFEGRTEDASVRVAGAVTRTLAEASQYRSSIANERRSDVSMFLAKQEQFASSPLVTIHREWADAMREFLARENVETMLVPPGTDTLEIILNRDPDIAKGIERRIKTQQAELAAEERARKQKEAQFKTPEGLQVTPQ